MPRASRSMKQVGQSTPGTGQRDLSYREVHVRASTVDADGRTVEATIATPLPVDMPDWERWEMVPEVLLGSGAQIPKSKQIPFLDSHNRSRIKDQLGSARNVRKDGENVVGQLHFSTVAEDEFTKVREGHVTDVSVGYRILQKTYVEDGKSKTIRGVRYDGPVNVVTKWRVDEVSLTPIGADEQAKLRGIDLAANPFGSRSGRGFTMNEELRALLISRGMPKDLDDDAAQRWMLENAGTILTPVDDGKRKSQPADPDSDPASDPSTAPARRSTEPSLTSADIQRMINEAIGEVAKAERERVAAFNTEVRSLCELAGMPESFDHCRQMEDVNAVRTWLVEQQKQSEQTVGGIRSVRITGEGRDRLREDISSALNLRVVQRAAKSDKTVEAIVPAANRSKNLDQWRHASIFDMAHELVRADGWQTRNMTREDVAIIAMFGPEPLGLRHQRDAAYHTTGDFTNITLDAMNKGMMVGYTEAPSTWRGPMRQGTSVQDFKTIHRVRMGAIPNLPVWNDNDDPNSASMADAREFYAVESRSLEVSYSYRLLVNDDMDAFSRTAPQLGQAAARTVNAQAWSQVTSNPTMSDQVALFATATGARKRTNLTTGAGAPSVTTLQTLTNLMMQMRGENTPEGNESDDILNLQPRYIVGPSALSTTIKQLVLSAYDPAATNHLTYNTATELIPIIEPLLDSNSTTAWYLFADPGQIDTIELTFLAGQENPVVRQSLDHKKLAQSLIVLQTFGTKAMNHRGMQKHAGA